MILKYRPLGHHVFEHVADILKPKEPLLLVVRQCIVSRLNYESRLLSTSAQLSRIMATVIGALRT